MTDDDSVRRDFNARPTSEAASHAQDGRRRAMWERVWAVHQWALAQGWPGITDHKLWQLIDPSTPDGTVRNRRVDLEHMGLLKMATDSEGNVLTEPSPLTRSAMILWTPTRTGPLLLPEWLARPEAPAEPKRRRPEPAWLRDLREALAAHQAHEGVPVEVRGVRGGWRDVIDYLPNEDD